MIPRYRLAFERYLHDGSVRLETLPLPCGDFATAQRAAIRLQDELDEAGEAVTVRVLDADGIPCWSVGSPEPERPSAPEFRRVA